MNTTSYSTGIDRQSAIFISLVSAVFVLFTGFLFITQQYYEAYRLVVIPFALVIVAKPHWGLILTIGTLPVLEVLPEFPVLSSGTALLGLLTLLSYVANFMIQRHRIPLRIYPVHWLFIIFILWVVGTHPSAATSSPDRNWIFTLAQLLILMWLAPQLLDTPQKQQMLMFFFILFSVISAITIFQGYNASTYETLEEYLLERQGGLVGGSNTAARYFTIATIFAAYLWFTIGKNAFMKLFLTASIIILVAGVFWTYSRTSMLLQIIAAALFMTLFPSQQLSVRVLLILLIIGIVILTVPSEVFARLDTVSASIEQKSDTVGLRYDLWNNSLKMWQDYPIAGIGIGQFQYNIRYYQPYDRRGRAMPAVGVHNIYLQLLSENGAVGLVLYMIIPITAALWFWKSRFQQNSALAATWLIALLILLIGGLTKHDTFDKLLWFILGMSLYFSSSYFKINPQWADDTNQLREV